MQMKFVQSIILFLFCINAAFSQEKWSLEQCIQKAIENSLNVKQAKLGMAQAEVNLRQNRAARLPNLNAGINTGLGFGRSINPITNTFIQQNFLSNTFFVGGDVPIYGGNQIKNSIDQSRIDAQAALYDTKNAENTIALSVAAAYLNILLAEEQLVNAQKRLEQSQSQLNQTDKLIQAGSLPQNDRLDILADIAVQQQGIVDAQNLVAINYLTLKQSMNIEPSIGVIIEKPELLESMLLGSTDFSLNEVYTNAAGIMPNIKANDLRLRSLELNERIVKGNLRPSLQLRYSIDTRFAKVISQDFNEPDYFDQLNDNFNQGLTLALNIPIFNRLVNKTNLELAKLNTTNQQLINEQAHQQLKTDIQRAIADAKAAQGSLEAAKVSLEAASAAFENAQKSFDLGAINSLDFTTARNRLDQAQVELSRSKYQFIFNLKVVEFYQGKSLSLDN